MIFSMAELRVALGLTPTITETQAARLFLAQHNAHSAVRKYLRYDPEQSLGPAEFYPRADTTVDIDALGEWETNAARTRAIFESNTGLYKYLQLERIPVRSVQEVRVDYAARFGQQSGDFGSGTEWAQGTEFAIEWTRDGFCPTGQLIAVNAWPATLGTVRVTYRAGYSPLEFSGPQRSSSTDADGNITTAGVDAAPIKAAAIMTGVASYHELANFSQSALTGMLIPGPKSSESMGSYSYSLASGASASLLSAMMAEVPPRAAQLMEGFQHYGVFVT